MIKEKINVPEGIRYMSQWVNFELPNYPHIMNKVVTGCGFTEYFLRPNPKYPYVILVSPRKILLENKEYQHNDPRIDDPVEKARIMAELGEVYYARNKAGENNSYDVDMNSLKLTPEDEEEAVEDAKRNVAELKDGLRNYIMRCMCFGQNIRIMVTYDSFRHVKDVLGSSIGMYQVVVDEFQSIFTDSRFKSDTELELLDQLRDLQRVCFLSATPMLDEYLELLDDFKDLPYFSLDWDTLQPGRVHKPRIDSKQCVSVVGAAKEEIDRYLKGDFERCSWRDNDGNIQEVYSKELVIYVNSVKNICDIIRKNKLRYDQCNVLCANTRANRRKVRDAFRKVLVDQGMLTRDINLILPKADEIIGYVPQEGEPHKMFTFCTRTVYLGADFYSTCARSLILSDANVDCLAVDISLDLPQILGRQRLVKINPWANCAIFRFKTNTKDITEEKFNQRIEEKKRKTNSLLGAYGDATTDERKHDLSDNYQKVARLYKYRDDYVAVNVHRGSDLRPVFNNLVLVSERRAFDIQQKDYADRFSVITEVSNQVDMEEVNKVVTTFLHTFEGMSLGKEKMKFLCEFLPHHKDIEEEILMNVPLAYKNYYLVLGPERCWQFSYQMSKLEEEYQRQLSSQRISLGDIQKIIYDTFQEGERYTKSDLKKAIQGIYDSLRLKKTGKANDFEYWFNLKRCNIIDSVTKKKKEGFELLKRKF